MFDRVLNTPRLSRFILIIKSPHFLHRDIRNVLEKTPKCLAIFDSCHSDDVTKVWVNAVVTRRNVIISQRCICSLKNIIAVLALKGWDNLFYDKEPVDILWKLFVIEATDCGIYWGFDSKLCRVWICYNQMNCFSTTQQPFHFFEIILLAVKFIK